MTPVAISSSMAGRLVSTVAHAREVFDHVGCQHRSDEDHLLVPGLLDAAGLQQLAELLIHTPRGGQFVGGVVEVEHGCSLAPPRSEWLS